MDWKLSLWSSVELFEQARSPGRVVRVDQETKVGFNCLVSFHFLFSQVKDGNSESGDTFTLNNYGEEVVEFR